MIVKDKEFFYQIEHMTHNQGVAGSIQLGPQEYTKTTQNKGWFLFLTSVICSLPTLPADTSKKPPVS
jgi:hypothetical protein